MYGTKISFLKAILADEKKALKTIDVNMMEIPNYHEISVTNMYDDAMGDPEVALFLPSKEQLSNKLPERRFFFGVLATVRAEYLKEIIEDAHRKRFKVEESDPKKQGIVISDEWMAQLQKYPYFSSKF